MDPKLAATVQTIARNRDWEIENRHRWPAIDRATATRIESYGECLRIIAACYGYANAPAMVDEARGLIAGSWTPAPAPMTPEHAAYHEPMGGWEPRT